MRVTTVALATVVGVAPVGFDMPDAAMLWIPRAKWGAVVRTRGSQEWNVYRLGLPTSRLRSAVAL